MIWLPKYVICAKMKTFLVIFLCLFVENVPLTRAADEVCPSTTQPVYINDVDVGVRIFNLSLPSSGKFEDFVITGVTSITEAIAKTYFKFDLTGSTLFLSTTDELKNVGRDAAGTVVVISISASLSCDGGNSKLPIIVKISDTFSHQPIFSKESYIYSVPMPIMPRTDITLYGDDINIEDINFSNTNMALSVTPEDFTLTVVKSDDKHFKAVFSAKSILRFTENQTYSLVAMNSGNKSSSVQITIAVDPVAGLDSPSFTKSFYSFDYSGQNGGSLTPKDGDIVVNSDKMNEAQYKLDGDLVSNFRVSLDNNTKTFQLALGSSLPSDVADPVILTLSFTTDATTNTILLIHIVNEDVIPKFSSDYYIGTYDVDTNGISWKQEIKITDAADVKLADGNSSLFTIDKTSFNISPINPLTESDFDENLNIVFEAIATSSSKNEARSIVVISLKTAEVLMFDNAYYSAAYTVKDDGTTGVVTLNGDIGFASGILDFTGIDIQVDSSHKSNFKIELDSSSSKWKISVPIPLNDTTLKQNSELSIPISATKTGVSGEATAILILALPEQVEIKFDSPYYTASYVVGTEIDSVELDQKISVSGATPGDVKITVEGYEDIFGVNWNSEASLYQISVKEDLHPSILDSQAFLALKLIASTPDGNSTDNSVVVLKLPKTKIAFQFKKSHYEATYEVVSLTEATVTLANGNIEILDAEGIDIQFSYDGFEANFALKYYAETSSYGIDVLNILDPNMFETTSELIVTIKASTSDGSYSTNTVLILALPQKTLSFKFAKNHYSAAYNISGDSKGIVTLNDGPIEVTDAADVELEFSFEGFEDNFNLIYSTETFSYGIDVPNNLNTSVLQLNSELVITIKAFIKDKNYSSNTVLILSLPLNDISFKFAKEHYSADYSIGSDSKGIVTVRDGPIKIIDDTDVVLEFFSFEGFEDIFLLRYNTATSSYGIEVLENLNASVLQSNTELIITINALKGDKSYSTDTVLILSLPPNDISFKFAKNHYSADYNVGGGAKGVVTLRDGPIEILDAVDVELEFSYEGFEDIFKLTYNTQTSSYGIEVLHNLNDSVLQSNSELVITIQALTKDKTYSSNTVLILSLPPTDISFKFAKSHYAAEYNVGADSKGVVILRDGPIEIVDAVDVELEFSYEEFEDIFKLTYNTQTSSYGIEVLRNLNDSVLESNSELVITIQALTKDKSYSANTVLILSLPPTDISFKFAKSHYAAEYNVGADSKGVVILRDGPIEIVDAVDVELEFSYEEFEDIFKLTYNTQTSSYGIEVLRNLNDSVLESNSELVITIQALTKDKSYSANTVLILSLPPTDISFKFAKSHYAADYNIGGDGKGVVTLRDGPIEIVEAVDVELEFSYEEFEDIFKLTYNTQTSSYGIEVLRNLNDSVLESNSELVITIQALTKDKSYSANTVLILSLPPTDISFKFAKSHYAADYNIGGDGKGVVTLRDGPIEIVEAVDVELEFSYEEFEDIFKLTYNTQTSSYGIEVLRNLNDSVLESNSELVITIQALTKDKSYSANTVLILSLPPTDISFKFAKSHYAADYNIGGDGKGVVTLRDGPIEIVEAVDVELEFSYEEFEDIFKLTYNTQTSSYGIEVLRNLNDSVLESNSELVITIQALTKDKSYSANTVLILSLPPTDISFKFAKSHYAADYNIGGDGKGVVTLRDGPIEIVDAVDVELEFSYEEFEDIFKLTYNTQTSSYGIEVLRNLNDSVLESNSELVITIQALTKDKSYSANTVLILSLPPTDISFKFAKSHYAAEYNVGADSKGVVILRDGPIEIVDAVDVELEFSYEEFEDIFKLTYNTQTSSYGIEVLRNLNDSVLESNSELVITIQALTKDKSYSANTVLILSLPPTDISFKFAKSHYAADYNIGGDGKGVVTLRDGPIEIVDAVDVELEFSYEEFEDIFKLTYNTQTSSYGIEVLRNLNDGVLESNSELVITIQALTKDKSYSANTVLILSLPPTDISFKFAKSHYAAEYNVGADSKGVVILRDGPIEIVDAVDVELEFSYEEFEDIFKLTYNTQTSSYGIEVLRNLNDSVLESNSELVITIQALTKDKSYSANTVLILSLPPTDISFKFAKSHYAADYNIGGDGKGVVTLRDGPIEIVDAVDVELEFSYEEFEDIFKLTYNTQTSSYGIEVLRNLNDSVLESNSELVITIQALTKDKSYSANTVLILSLPPTDISFKFAKSHYAADYNIGGDGKGVVTLRDGPIEIVDAVDVELEFSYEEFEDIFKLTYNTQTSSYGIEVLRNLNDSVLESNSELVITIQALTKDKSYSANTVLILSLPPTDISFKFAKSHYAADYNIGGDGKGVVTLRDGPIEIVDAVDVELEFSYEEFEDIFKLTYNTQTSSYGIEVLRNLNDSVLESNSELVITIQALTKDKSYSANTVLILSLPPTDISFKFAKSHYAADYNIGGDGKGVVTLRDGPIEIVDAVDVELEFSYEEFEDIFKLTYNTQTSSYGIEVLRNLNDGVLESNSELVITIQALTKDKSYSANTVLILSLPPTDISFKFAKSHYAAEYNVGADSKGVVILRDGPIEIVDAVDVELEFSYEEFEDIFKLTYNTQTSSYGIEVLRNLNDGVLESNSELVITIQALTKDKSYSANTVLILSLPSTDISFKFAKSHYAADYNIGGDGKGIVTLRNGPIEIVDAVDVQLEFSYEGYEKYFALLPDGTGVYTIKVVENLNDSVLEQQTQLIITIVASTKDPAAAASAQTVLILDLPDHERSLAFAETYYTATYSESASVKLDELIVLNNQGYVNIQFSLNVFDETFSLESDQSSGTYHIKTIQPLDNTTLSLNTELVIVITATDADSSTKASTALLVKLPSYDSNIFESGHYVADYLLSTDSGTDAVNVVDTKIKVKTALYTQISFEGYDKNFEGTCNSTTLECAITVKVNLNPDVLANNNELLVTIIGSNTDLTSTGKAVLLLRLPAKTSTFSFAKLHYGANYSIQKSDEELATIKLTDRISFDGADPKRINITVSSDYSEYFSITYDSSSWNINILKNLNADILKDSTELVVSLTAANLDQPTDYAKATLVIKLPDSTTVSFGQPQYSAEYVMDDPANPKVVLDSYSEIGISEPENSQIVLSSFVDNFAIQFDSSDSKWKVIISTPLSPTILSQYSELPVLITITKIGVSYGTAGLTIRLPPLTFSKDLYSGSYSVDDNGVGSVSDIEIAIDHADTSCVKVELTKYTEYFYTELTDDGKWTIKVGTSLPPEITGALVMNLRVIRISDSKILATSTLEISVPSEGSTDAPKFADITFSGSYKNSDPPVVELGKLIGFATDNAVSASSVVIDPSDEYSTNFILEQKENNEYSIAVQTPLSQDVIDNVTTIVLTLVAKSVEGYPGYATLVISLPKAVREPSVQVEDEEILFSGTYEKGEFTGPIITLNTNSTNDEDILVKISNDLGIDDGYFKPIYSNKVLSIQVGELPQDILNSTSVIPLKLAITDRTTQDTIFAVLNIEISGYSNDNGDGDGGDDGDDSSPVGLIVATVLLAVLLILLILAVFLFWYFKLRSTGYAEMTNEEQNIPTTKTTTTFTKHETKNPATTLSSASLRRPTGLPYMTNIVVPEESSSDHDILVSLDDSPPSSVSEKRVAFNDTVANIDMDGNDGYQYVRPVEVVSSSPLRRPTGLPIRVTNIVPGESSSDQDVLVSLDSPPSSDLEKKVAFNDAVASIDMDDKSSSSSSSSSSDEDEVHNVKPSEVLQHVAGRRPTKFVFGYPLEEGLFDNEEGRRESSDYESSPGGGDKRKVVAFDEHVERMHIDPVEDGDEDGDEVYDEPGNEDDDNAKAPETSLNNTSDNRFKVEAQIQISGDEQLPSHILKEVF